MPQSLALKVNAKQRMGTVYQVVEQPGLRPRDKRLSLMVCLESRSKSCSVGEAVGSGLSRGPARGLAVS